MKLHCAPLSLFLCSIGAAQARVSSHNTVLEVEADANRLLNEDMLKRSIKNDNGACISIKGNSRIISGTCTDSTRWDLRRIQNGKSTYTIKQTGTDQCLGVKKNKFKVSECNTNNLRADNQKWDVVNDQIENTEEEKCMEVKGSSVKLEDCSNSKKQKFIFPEKSRQDNPIKMHLKSVSAGKKKCMIANGDDIKSDTCRKKTYWKFFPNTEEFQYNDSGRCLDATNGKNGAATINKCNGKDSQKWEKIVDVPTSIRSNYIGQCLKFNEDTKKFNLRDCGTGQQFQFTFDIFDVLSEVKNVE